MANPTAREKLIHRIHGLKLVMAQSPPNAFPSQHLHSLPVSLPVPLPQHRPFGLTASTLSLASSTQFRRLILVLVDMNSQGGKSHPRGASLIKGVQPVGSTSRSARSGSVSSQPRCTLGSPPGPTLRRPRGALGIDRSSEPSPTTSHARAVTRTTAVAEWLSSSTSAG